MKPLHKRLRPLFGVLALLSFVMVVGTASFVSIAAFTVCTYLAGGFDVGGGTHA